MLDFIFSDENSGKSPREPLAPRLAILKMQLEERRRHIEEEKKRMIEQWNEERIRVGQQAFWFAVGNKDGKVEDEKTKNGSKVSGCLRFFQNFKIMNFD